MDDSTGRMNMLRLVDRLGWIAAFGILAVPAIVVPAVIWARVTFHALHPDFDLEKFPTISRAISDPLVGEPFAFWVTIAAVILWGATHYMLRMLLCEHPSRATLGAGRDRLGRALLAIMSVMMTATCIGMVMLSHNRLGAGASGYRMHMLGSYVFFAGQAATILLAAVYHSLVARAHDVEGRVAFFPDRWRARLGYSVTAAAVAYGVVFKIKSMDLGAATRVVVTLYIELETVLIFVFLLYLLLYFVDALRFSRRESLQTEMSEAPGETALNTAP